MTSTPVPPLTKDAEEEKKMVQETLNKIKSQGLFDQFRKDCLADVDTKPAAQNLRQRVEGFVARFLATQQWSPNLNKNQLRDALRKHINQSGMLTQGVERIIEQVVNPKILQVIKPKIDEVVCAQLGLDCREWQVETARRKNEAIRQHQLQQQQKIQAVINSIQQQQQLQQQQQQQVPSGSSASSMAGVPGDYSVPPPGMFPTQEAGWQMGSGMFGGGLFSQSPFGSPFSFAGMGQQAFLGYMQGWGVTGSGGLPGVELFPQQQQQQQTPPAPPPPTQSPAVQPSPLITPTTFSVPGQQIPLPSTPVPLIAPPPPASIIPPPPLPAAPPPAILDLSKPPPTSDVPTTALDFTKPPPMFGSSGSMSLLTDPPPPGTELALHSISLPVSSSPVVPAKVEPATAIHSFLSPRLLAEAMIESPTPKLGKKCKKDWQAKQEPDDADKVEVEYITKLQPVDTSPAIRNLFGTMSKSGNSEVVMDLESHMPDATCVKDIMLPGEAVTLPAKMAVHVEGEGEEDQQEGRRQYRFAWNEDEDRELSDVTISSVHTSDLSSLHESSDSSLDNEQSDLEDDKAERKDVEGAQQKVTAGNSPVKQPEIAETEEPQGTATPLQVTASMETKPRKLLALSYNYSDSDNEETREERKARIAHEKEERYLKRQVRRAEMEVKRKEREEEKARQREEKLWAHVVEASISDGTPVKDEKQDIAGSASLTDEEAVTAFSPVKTRSATASSSGALTSSQEEGASTPRAITTPRKKRRTKAEMKEELMQQKVQQRRAMRRQRTLNRRYASEEFTSIFSENRVLAPHLGLSDPSAHVVEEGVAVEWAMVEIDNSSVVEQEVEVQEECVVMEVETETDPSADLPVLEVSADVAQNQMISEANKLDDVSSRASSPYSDISTSETTSRSSFSDKSPPGRRHKRNSGDSSRSDQAHIKRSQRIQQQEEQKRIRSSSRGKGSELTESRSRTSQRYNMDDLYKPRTSHRRPLTPPVAAETPYGSQCERGDSDSMRVDRRKNEDVSLERGSSRDQRHHMPVTRSDSLSQEYTGYATRSRTGAVSPAAQGRQLEGEGKQGRVVTPSIMADLELEPVSPDDDSLDDVEEGEAKSPISDGNMGGISKDIEGEQKADSAEDVNPDDDDEVEKRRKSRIPIELVDFGEAARHTRSTVPPSGVGEWGGARWQEGRGYVGNKYGVGPPRPPPPGPPLPPGQYPDRSKMTWVASGGSCKSGSSQPPAETISHGHRYDRSKMVWVAPGAEKRLSFESGSESDSATNHSPPPRWEDTCSSPERDSKRGPSSRDSSVERSVSLPQRELYSPINDSSSSVISGSSATPPPKLAPRKKRARTTSSSSSSSSSSFSSSMSSSSSSLSVIRTPPPQPSKRRRKESELSDGEITSESSVEAEERYRYENLPKAVRKYQVPSKREHSPLSSQTSEHSFRSKGHRSQLSDSVGSKGRRSCSPPVQYSRSKRAHSSSPEYRWHDQKKQRKRSRRHASPEVRKIMLRVRSEQRVSEDSQESGQLSAGRQSTPSPPFVRLRSPGLGNLSASSVSSKSFSDSLPSPPPAVIQVTPLPPTGVETPSTPGIQDEQATPITSPSLQGRRPLPVAPLATSPVSEGEFEHVDKDEDTLEQSGFKKELSSPEEGQRSPSPPTLRLEALRGPTPQTLDPASHKLDPIPQTLDPTFHTPDLILHTEGPAPHTPDTKTGTERAPSPPQLRRQWKPSDDWHLPVSTQADGLSPQREKLMVLWYPSGNQGSPYLPPPVLSVERSPVSLAVDQGEASPTPPLLESQAGEQQVPSPPSTPSPPPLPPLPESPCPPAPQKSPSVEKAEAIEVPDSVTRNSAETVPVTSLSHVVQESAETVPVASLSHHVVDLMPSLPAPLLQLSPLPQRDHNHPPSPLLSQHLGSASSPPLPTLSPNPELESGEGQQPSVGGGNLSTALLPVLVLSLQDSSNTLQSQIQTDTASLPSPTSPTPLQLPQSLSPSPLQEHSAATLLQQSFQAQPSLPPTRSTAVMDPSPLPPALHDTAERLSFIEASAPAQNLHTEFVTEMDNESAVSVAASQSVTASSLSEHPEERDPHMLRQQIHPVRPTFLSDSPNTSTSVKSTKSHYTAEVVRPSSQRRSELVKLSSCSVASVKCPSPKSLIAIESVKPPSPQMASESVRSASPKFHVKAPSPTVTESVKPHSPALSTSPPETVTSASLPVASVKPTSPKSLIAAESVNSPSPLDVHSPSESAKPLSPLQSVKPRSPPIFAKSAKSLSLGFQILQSAKPTSSVDSRLASEPAKHPAKSPPPKSPSASESVKFPCQQESSDSETKYTSQPKSPNSTLQLPKPKSPNSALQKPELKSPNSTPQSPIPKSPNSGPQSPKVPSPVLPPVPHRRETRSSSQISCGHQEEVRQMVTRRGSGAPQREMRRPCPATPPVRETRSRQDKSPPAKRTRH